MVQKAVHLQHAALADLTVSANALLQLLHTSFSSKKIYFYCI